MGKMVNLLRTGFIGMTTRMKFILGFLTGILSIASFLTLGWVTQLNPIFGSVGLGIVLGSVGTLFYAPLSLMTSDPERMGILVGMMRAIESLSWTILAPLFGLIYEQTGSFS